ncbi:MAG: hypothetical protein JWP87_5835 [Labilithrix sp.]|nr:hypothetical protein [Labilithrix sp.]
MALHKLSRMFVVPAVLVVACVVVACAKGESPDLGLLTAEATQPTEPPPPSQTLPSPSPSPKPSDDDSGTGSSASSSGASGSSGGSSPSGGTPDAGSSGGTSSGGVDAGGCATVPPSNACGLSPQCGCTANHTCDVTNNTTGAVSCVVSGGGPIGSSCTTTSQCANGLTCGYNTCRPYCPTTGAACVGTGGQCTPYYDPTAGTAVPNSKVCTVTCDLRSPSAACGSNNCIFDTTINATDCDKSGTKALYAACTRYNDCQQGLACTKHPVYGFECEKWCRIGQNDCGSLETCTDVYGATAPSSGGAKLGHCQ